MSSEGFTIETTVDLVEALRLDGYAPAYVILLWQWLKATGRETDIGARHDRAVYNAFLAFLDTELGQRAQELWTGFNPGGRNASL